jgi:hypothetical protein
VFSETGLGGTSVSAPLVAGMVVAAQQGTVPVVQVHQPALYRLAGTSAVHDVLPLTSSSPARWHAVACPAARCFDQALVSFDDQSHSMLGYTGQVTLRGCDNMTGVGTPVDSSSSPPCAT